MNQFTLSGNRSKPSIANIIGFCGFALLAIIEIVPFLYFISRDSTNHSIFGNIMSTIMNVLSTYGTPVAYVAIGCFFVMDMVSHKGYRKILDIIGLVAVGLSLAVIIRNYILMYDVEQYSINEIQSFQFVNFIMIYSAFFLFCLFFSGFNENARLRIPSIFVLAGVVIRFLLFYWAGFEGFDIVYFAVSSLTLASMAWFMYEYMRQPQDAQNIETQDSSTASPFPFRAVAAAVCLCVGIAALFLPYLQVRFFGSYSVSMYDLWEHLGRGDADFMKMRILLFLYIPAIVFYAASILDKDNVKPIIAFLLTVVPLIGLIRLGASYSGWMFVFVLLYVALIYVTVKIVVSSPRCKNDE